MVKHKLKSGHEIYLDQMLQFQLDTLIYNIKSDWDYVIVITGDRMVRTGKSVLALNIGAYIADRVNTNFGLENIHFDSQEMITFAQDSPKMSVIVYDEGREGLAASKSSKTLQKDLLDYFAECGQLNHIFIVVLPDFFELKENMAVARSEYLINVWRRSVRKEIDMYKDGINRPIIRFDRGYFEFFSRKKKSLLYDISKSKHRKNYQLVSPDFKGRFTNNYPIDEEMYREKKREALQRFKERKLKEKENKYKDVLREFVLQSRKDGKTWNELEETANGILSAKTLQRLIEERGKSLENEV